MEETAVEWLEKEFVKLESTVGVHGVMYELIEQAKEMEKQQIENAYNVGNPYKTAEQYYNQTFKSE
jgi:hypothetical protein